MQTWIQLENVSVRLAAVTALKQVSLRIAQGERVALVGSNGSGKSTLLRTLHGLLKPEVGRVQCDEDVRQAMLFQRPHLLRASVLTNVALALWLDRARHVSWRTAREQAAQALQEVGLLDVSKQSGRQLSGGQSQRVAFARALARKPDVLLLDEPTANLDPHAKREVETLMRSFAVRHDGPARTLVWASHNLGQVKRLATRVMYLEGGQLLADLPVDDFFNETVLAAHSPAAHAFVQGEQ
jgi:tungstate transport system ATP-binding protein